ncbi:hypothetical protein J4439_03900 [Candidatus Woesearchaeota archaeon]|nr:hypothetical protein [Candidatus Woesearchaeota archaeon]
MGLINKLITVATIALAADLIAIPLLTGGFSGGMDNYITGHAVMNFTTGVEPAFMVLEALLFGFLMYYVALTLLR